MNRRSQKRIKDMANLNFQQPPRNIPNQSLSRTAFTSSTLSGHVTPTNMFPGSANSFTPQQLSPNRNNIPAMGNRTLFSQQRAFPERRHINSMAIQDWNSSSVASINSIGQNRTFNSHNSSNNSSSSSSFQSMFNNAYSNTNSISCDSNSPPLLDLSEFPSLTNRGQNDSLPQQLNSSMPGKQPYVGMVKAPTSEPSEFTMSNEDFPALPGTQPTSLAENSISSSSSSINSEKLTNHDSNSTSEQVISPSSSRLGNTSAAPGAEKHQLQQQQQLQAQAQLAQPQLTAQHNQQQFTLPQHQIQLHHQLQQQQIQQQQQQQLHQTYQRYRPKPVLMPPTDVKQPPIMTYPDGRITNIPGKMIKDQFGIIGLLTFIRAAESDKNVVSLALGQDLTALGLNLNSSDSLHPSFAGPWVYGPCRPQEIECPLPPEYIINQTVKLPEVKLQRFKDDLLFFLFYMFVGDTLQMAAASELYSRDWRFHIEEKVWISHSPGLGIIEKTPTYERGMYYFFDAQNWRKVPKEFHLDYSKLDSRPIVPQLNSL